MITATIALGHLPRLALLNQSELSQTDPFLSIFPLVIAFCMVGLPIVGAYLVFRYQSAARDQLHHERLAAIEAGIDPQVGAEVTASERYLNQAFWIAFWMVVCGSGASFISVGRCIQPETDVRLATVGWIAAGLSSVVASIAAGLLIIKAKPVSSNSA